MSERIGFHVNNTKEVSAIKRGINRYSKNDIAAQQYTVPVRNYFLPLMQSPLHPIFEKWFLNQGYVAPTLLVTTRQTQSRSTIASNVPIEVPSL